MNKLHLLSVIIGFIILILISCLSFYAHSIDPSDWCWAIHEEILLHSDIDSMDSEIILLDEDWDSLVRPFIDIDNISCIKSIDIHIVHPIKREYSIGYSWKGENGYKSMDEYLRDNSDYMIKITGWRPKMYIVLLLATSPLYYKSYNKNYDEQEASGIVIDFNLEEEIRKTYIMVYDDQNVFYEKDIDAENRIYRKMPQILLQKFIFTYKETMKEFKKNTR